MSNVEKAVSCFNEGFSCSQSVLSAYAGQFGLDRETALRLAGGFGGGMGRMGEVCGALTGAFMVIGLKYGSAESGESDSKIRTYELVYEAAERFRARNGCMRCRDLLGIDIHNPEEREQAREQGVFSTKCPGFVRDAAEIIEELLKVDIF